MPNSLTIKGPIGDMLASVYDQNKDSKVDVIESQISDLDHNAQKIKGVIIDDAAIGDQKVLAYDLATQTLVYITQAPAGAALNSIQSAQITIPLSSSSATATITEVDTTKSAILFLGAFCGMPDVRLSACRVTLTNPTTVTANRALSTSSIVTKIAFLVIEFSTGINSAQQGTIYIPPSSTYTDHTITEVDLAKALLFYCGFSSAQAVNYWSAVHPIIQLLNSTTIRASMFFPGNQTHAAFSLLEFL